MSDKLKETTFEPRDDEICYKYTDNKGEQRVLYMENTILAKLLIDDVVFVGDFDTGPFFKANNEEDRPEHTTVCVWVNCNDVFAWGCADSENVLIDELPELYKMHMADKKWGVVKWCCKKRNIQPQKPIIRDMKKDNSWDELMESLTINNSY